VVRQLTDVSRLMHRLGMSAAVPIRTRCLCGTVLDSANGTQLQSSAHPADVSRHVDGMILSEGCKRELRRDGIAASPGDLPPWFPAFRPSRSGGVERHSMRTRLVTRGEDELWITPFA
jgi:hypothetical protein